MKLFVTGTADRLEEFKKIAPATQQVVYHAYKGLQSSPAIDLTSFDVIADLNLDEYPAHLNFYSLFANKPIIGGAVKKSLKEITAEAGSKINCCLTGLNTLPTFINRTKKEVSFIDERSKNAFKIIAKELNWEWEEVRDGAGMVTPRVIMMIINEACCTLNEGTAGKEDIDKGMKLGTAYPSGPLEWADRIGIANVYETLKAIYKESGDKRYQISPLLESMYANGSYFYR